MIRTTALRVAASTAAIAGALMAGCEAGPNYHRPALTMAPSFSTWPATQPSTAPAARTAQVPVDLAHWWQALHDPELDSLLNRAVANNLDLEIAITRLQQAEVNLSIFGGQTLPALNFSAVAGGGTTNNITRGGQVDAPLAAAVDTSGLRAVTQALGVDTSFQVDLFGNLRREGEALSADATAAGEFRNQVLITLLGQVTRTYINVRTLQQRVTIAEQAIAAQQQSANVVHERFNRGITNELDVALADRELQTTEAVLSPLQAQLIAAKRRLAVLLGEAPDQLMEELDAQAPLPQPPGIVDAGLPGELLRRRPDVRQAEAQLIATNARLGVATSRLYPRIFLTGAAGVEGQGLGVEPVVWRNIWEAAPVVQWPLLDFGQTDAAIQFYDQATRGQIANYRRVVLSAIEEVDDNLTGYDAERHRLANLAGAVAAAQRALDLANQRYNRGIIDFLNVLDAERSLYGLKDQQAVSEDAAVADFVNVCQSLGGGWQGFAPPPPLKKPMPALLAAFRDATGHSDRPD